MSRRHWSPYNAAAYIVGACVLCFYATFAALVLLVWAGVVHP